MIKHALTYSVKVLKISTWLSAVIALLLVLIVGFFVLFPTFLKVPIQQQLSVIIELDVNISKITFGFDKGHISIKMHDIQIASPETQQVLLGAKNLHWQLDWSNLFNGSYPNKIDIDLLSIYADGNSFSITEIKTFLRPEVLQSLDFIESISVNKTMIVDYNFELAPLLLSVDKTQLKLDIFQQIFGSKTFDISATFLLSQIQHKDIYTLPITFQGEDFKLLSTLKFYNQQNHDFVEFNATAKHIDVVHVSQYLPTAMIDGAGNEWLNQAFKAGKLNNINIHVKQNMLEQYPQQVTFSAHLNDAELLFHPDWQNLEQLDADININGKRLDVKVSSAVLNKLNLQNIDVQILDMSKDTLNVGVIGQVSAQSERLIEFLKTTPLSEVVEPILEQFTLSGQVEGEVNLMILLDDEEPVIDVDLNLKDNLLTVLDGAIVVDNFNSKVVLHDNKISTNGYGNIRGKTFNIRLNPSNRTGNKNTLFTVELANEEAQFNAYISQQTEQLWQAKITSDALQTDVEIVLNNNDLPSVELLNLKVATLDKIKGDWKISPSDLPSMHLEVKGVWVDDYQLPNFKVDLHSQQKVFNINNLEFEGIGVNQDNLVFNGTWLGGITTLIAQAKGDKLSDFLEKMNVKEKVEGGEFDFDVRLFCQCSPWNLNLKDISGYISTNVKQGVFTEQDPNIGRLLSLLNIQSIARRLKLQVNDLTSKGFAYDDIQASVYLGNALAKIDNFELNSTSSTIRLTGNSNIIEQQYNLVAKVRPAIGDAVPIATYLAGGGLAGLGIWLADKVLFDGKIMEAIVDNVAEFKYKISGAWNNPVIK